MTATFKSNLQTFLRDHARARDLALVRGAMVYQEAVQARLRQGYTTGAFTSGKAADNVILSDITTEDGVSVIRVGTGWARALEWEMGFLNRWTDQWERVPIWVPLAQQHGPRIAAVIGSTYRAQMAQWRAD